MSEDASQNIEEEKMNVLLKYFKVVFLSNPFYHYFQYGTKINHIFEELEKTKLPKIVEKQNSIASIQFKGSLELSIGIAVSTLFLFKVKKISFLNRCFIIAIFSTCVLYIVEIRKKDRILDNILYSMTHYGQEARILTKFYIPNHRKIVGIQNCMELFRQNAEMKRTQLIKDKQLIERIIEKENNEDQKFYDEVAKDFEKNDFGKDL